MGQCSVTIYGLPGQFSLTFNISIHNHLRRGACLGIYLVRHRLLNRGWNTRDRQDVTCSLKEISRSAETWQ